MLTIIPVKPFDQAKSRLAKVLSPAARSRLSRNLLCRTIGLAVQVGRVAVISRSPQVRRVAKQAGAWALVEAPAEDGLNAAVWQAQGWAAAQSPAAVLILPADLPHLQLADLEELHRLATAGEQAVIAPCRRQDGTNALLLSPPQLIRPAFGPGSFARHCRQLRTIGVEPYVYQSGTVSFDLDIPEDLRALPGQLSEQR